MASESEKDAAQLVVANATIAATNLNPSVFSQMWLAQHGIIPPEESVPGSVYTDVVVQAQASSFWLLVVPQQLQFMPRNREVPSSLAREKIQRIVTLLPHVPYAAVGLNFVWQSAPIAEIGTLGRKIFTGVGAPFDRFKSPDARFGTYVSKDVGVARLRLDIRPIHTVETPQVERLQFAFNFQRLVKDEADKPAAVVDVVGRWDEYEQLANEIVKATLESA